MPDADASVGVSCRTRMTLSSRGRSAQASAKQAAGKCNPAGLGKMKTPLATFVDFNRINKY